MNLLKKGKGKFFFLNFSPQILGGKCSNLSNNISMKIIFNDIGTRI